MSTLPDCFNAFNASITEYQKPERFNFPFYYDPHPLCLLASKELQAHLKSQTDFKHNFGLDPEDKSHPIGKMFGVLLVETPNNDIGYLAAFSGKLAESNHHPRFVPPVFDILTKDGFFTQGILPVNDLNKAYEAAKVNPDYLAAKEALEATIVNTEQSMATLKAEMKAAKLVRRAKREEGKSELSEEAFEVLNHKLNSESIEQQYRFKKLKKFNAESVAARTAVVEKFELELAQIKSERKERSQQLQKEIFSSYTFLNVRGEEKSLYDIFIETPQKVPPAGAGECAAPKLLQYAFLHGLKPLSMAEFWWGASPRSEIRKHDYFYPACRGKCRPILGHMLDGIPMDPNPMLENTAEGSTMEIVYEDEAIVIVNKPAELLSVPGIHVFDSVYSRIRHLYPYATGPLIIHRLDMSTSGIMMLAKTKAAHKYLQYQFIKRTIKKRYHALLEGEIADDSGEIDLPMRPNIDNRPRQMVCFEHGKKALTQYEVVERKDGQTHIRFTPVTGRTHQLRVHAAHRDGLNAPIIGDDLYGLKKDRLHLHAEWISFVHPDTKEQLEFFVPAPF